MSGKLPLERLIVFECVFRRWQARHDPFNTQLPRETQLIIRRSRTDLSAELNSGTRTVIPWDRQRVAFVSRLLLWRIGRWSPARYGRGELGGR